MSNSNTVEKIIGSLVNVSGHTFDMVYDLFFTTERVIAVIIQHPADSPQSKSMWYYMFVGTFWTSGREQIKRQRTAREKRRNLQSMTPDELVSANRRNFAIPYSEITSVEVTRRFFQRQLRFHLSGSSDRERIARFNLSKKQVPEAERLLRKIPLAQDSPK
jgi:hypothetical protein